jgi:hypothetical protein
MNFTFTSPRPSNKALDVPLAFGIAAKYRKSVDNAIGTARVQTVNKCLKFVAQLLCPTGSWDVPPNKKKPEV